MVYSVPYVQEERYVMYNSKSRVILVPDTLPQINVVGIGALGSKIVDLLGRLGISCNMYDFDIVEKKNLGNQAFRVEDINKLKVDAAVDFAMDNCGVKQVPHNEKFEGKLNGITFITVDSGGGEKGANRRQFAEDNRYNYGCELVIEARMGLFDGRVYAYQPTNPIHFREYNKTLTFPKPEDTPEPVMSMCKIRQDLATSSHIIAGLAVNKLIYWNLLKEGREKAPITNEEIFGYLNGVQSLVNNVWK